MKALPTEKKIVGMRREWVFDVRSTETSAAQTSPRVLLAEDDDEMRSLVAWALLKEGYAVTGCSDGRSLLEYLDSLVPPSERFSFHLVISDIRMPGVSGLEVLEKMHQHGGFPPIILITAYGDEETHAQANRLGAVAILDKPFEIDDLLVKVREVLSPHSKGKIAFKEWADSARIETTIQASVKDIWPAVDRILELVRRIGCDFETEVEVELALLEALTNAVVHGCKKDSSKLVHLSVACHKSGGLSIVVRDPGPGFDPTSIPNPLKGENVYSTHGRGIFLINHLMDEVWFERGGREIHMRKRHLSSSSKLDVEATCPPD